MRGKPFHWTMSQKEMAKKTKGFRNIVKIRGTKMLRIDMTQVEENIVTINQTLQQDLHSHKRLDKVFFYDH